jgi:hypothetical protein
MRRKMCIYKCMLHIFLSNYWWQKSGIWSQASYRYPISWEAFLDASDTYFLFADFVSSPGPKVQVNYCHHLYKNQPSRQTGSRNLTGPTTLPTIWGTYMKLVTKYQISAINSYWEKCDENYLGRTGKHENDSWSAWTWVNFYYCRCCCCLFVDVVFAFYTPAPRRGRGYQKQKQQDELCANAHLWYPRSSANRKSESDGSKNASHNMAYLYEACDQISDSCHQ